MVTKMAGVKFRCKGTAIFPYFPLIFKECVFRPQKYALFAMSYPISYAS